MLQPDDNFAVSFWGDAMADEEPMREENFPLVEIQTSIVRRALSKYLCRPLRILDAGAGTGRYSFPLAGQGHRVTHLDISQAMLTRAMTEAAKLGLESIEFVPGDVKDLSDHANRAYDMTLCMDAPISYAYPDHARALAEVCRVSREYVALMVSSRSGVVPFMIDLDLSGEFLPPGMEGKTDPFLMTAGILEHGVEMFPSAIRDWLMRSGKLTPPDYAFTVGELTELLTREGFRIVEMGGPGALARSVRKETLEKILQDKALYDRFVEYSLNFDFDPHNLGLGAVNLFAVARRAPSGKRRRSTV